MSSRNCVGECVCRRAKYQQRCQCCLEKTIEIGDCILPGMTIGKQKTWRLTHCPNIRTTYRPDRKNSNDHHSRSEQRAGNTVLLQLRDAPYYVHYQERLIRSSCDWDKQSGSRGT